MLKKVLNQLFQGNTTASIFIIVIGSILWSLTMIKSGITYSYGMGFWGPNGHDGIWHLALINSLSNGSWQMPIFAGDVIKNYHIGFDIIVAIIHKLSFIPAINLYFQVLPPILAIFIGIFAYKFVYLWRKSKIEAFWSTFFVYFGGSWGWILSLIKSREIGGESLFWSQQSVSTLINPPFALSIIAILFGMILLLKGINEKNKKLLMLSTFIFGILIQIKVYAGVLILAGLFISAIVQMFRRGGVSIFKVFTGSLIVSILLFLPMNKGVESTLIYKPFWFLESMMATPDRLNWQKYAQALLNYKLGGIWIKGIIAYFIAFLIFLLGNLGTRIIGFFWLYKKWPNVKNYQYIDVLVVAIILTGIVLPMMFIQSGNSWNTIQFFYYSLLFSGILAGIIVGQLIKNQKRHVLITYTIITLLVLLTIPTTLGTLIYNYIPSRPPAKISMEELNALKFLSQQPEGIVLTQPFNKVLADEAVSNPPRPLYLYESTAYVSAFTGKRTYLEDEVNLEITGYNFKSRKDEELKFFSGTENNGYDFLRKNNISYIYFVNNSNKLLESNLGITEIFNNALISIYRIK